MTTTADTPATGLDPWLLTLSGVAELARVQRPVASMWRTRFATGDDAFPVPASRRGTAPLFHAREVAEWLVRTDHGNNPDAVADAAAAAAPSDLNWDDPNHVAELEALIVLSAEVGGLAGMTPEELVEAAAAADPKNEAFAAEVAQHAKRGTDWAQFADAIIDAAYSPAGALAVTRRRRARHAAGESSTGPLADNAVALVSALVEAIVRYHGHEHLVLEQGVDEVLAADLSRALGDELTLTVGETVHARALRRRLRVEGVWADGSGDGRVVRVARVPGAAGAGLERILTDAEDVLLALDGADAAVVLGPARALVGALPRTAREIRDAVLRSGRLRAVARLPRGLVTTAVREPLTLWVLGAPLTEVPSGERFTLVADLVDSPLTESVRDDLVGDLLASTGDAGTLHARRFRFARLARTTSLLTRSGSLLPSPGTRTHDTDAARHAVLLERAAQAAALDLPDPVAFTSNPGSAVPAATLTALLAARHVRLLPGTRLDTASTGSQGLVVVAADDLDTPGRIGARRIDPLQFAAQHASAQLTQAGDVIFRTGPTPAAWVDAEGSKVVAYPARVLRITAADPGGLVPEVVAVDIPTQPAGPGAWKRWMLRRVAPASIKPLRRALADVAVARSELERRIATLDQYVDTLTASVAAGAVTLTSPNDAATAAPTPQ